MTSECYFGECPKHSIHEFPNDGPFCYEVECTAEKGELIMYNKKRIEDLVKWKAEHEPNN